MRGQRVAQLVAQPARACSGEGEAEALHCSSGVGSGSALSSGTCGTVHSSTKMAAWRSQPRARPGAATWKV